MIVYQYLTSSHIIQNFKYKVVLKNVLFSCGNLCAWWHVLVRQTLCPILNSPDSDQIINTMYHGLLTELNGLAFNPEKDLQIDTISNAAFSV